MQIDSGERERGKTDRTYYVNRGTKDAVRLFLYAYLLETAGTELVLEEREKRFSS